MPIKDTSKRKEYNRLYRECYSPIKEEEKAEDDLHVSTQYNYNKRGDAKFLKALSSFKKYG